MQAKLKICDECGKESYIWAHKGKMRYCKSCTFKLVPSRPEIKKKFTPIPKRSEKRKKEEIAYQALRKVYLATHPQCEVNIQGVCSGEPAHEIHHQYSGKDREKYFLDTTTWKAVERNCHDWVHANPLEARELGFLK